MKNAPIIATLDLWSMGHTAGQIAAMLGYPNGKHVTRIIEHARQIGDPRAVFHHASNGRLIGRLGRTGLKVGKRGKIAGKEAVQTIGKPLCSRGHARIPENVKPSGSCKACDREAQARRRAEKRK